MEFHNKITEEINYYIDSNKPHLLYLNTPHFKIGVNSKSNSSYVFTFEISKSNSFSIRMNFFKENNIHKMEFVDDNISSNGLEISQRARILYEIDLICNQLRPNFLNLYQTYNP